MFGYRVFDKLHQVALGLHVSHPGIITTSGVLFEAHQTPVTCCPYSIPEMFGALEGAHHLQNCSQGG